MMVVVVFGHVEMMVGRVEMVVMLLVCDGNGEPESGGGGVGGGVGGCRGRVRMSWTSY